MDYEKKYKEAMKACKELSDAFDNETLTEELEKIFPELAELEDERIIKEMKDFFSHIMLGQENFLREDYDWNAWIAWLEKQGEQKPTDKVEPKFKVGDWVIYTGYLLKDSGKEIYVMQVASVENDRYNFTDTSTLCFDSEKDMRLWTIQDAKDGDVLTCESGWTCIFKTLVNDETFSSYCFMDKTKWFCATGNACHTLKEEFIKAYNGKIHPSTKEQRDLLFQKMKEAGYEWDAKKKELKNIEQNLACGEDNLPEFESYLCLMFQKFRTKGMCTNGEIIDYIKEHSQKLKDALCHPWSEEDEHNLNGILDCYKSMDSKWRIWLKSLKDRYTWKPSEEMLEALYKAIPENVKELSEDEMLLDKLYQGLKYGKVLSEK